MSTSRIRSNFLNKNWSVPMSVLFMTLLLALISHGYRIANTQPGVRQTLAMKLMPFAILWAGILTPLFYLLLQKLSFKGPRGNLNRLIIAVLVFGLSFGVGWMYLNWTINVPHLPNGLYKIITQELLTISMPFWMVIAGLIALMRVRRDRLEKKDKLANQVGTFENRIEASIGNKVYSIEVDDITWVKSEGNYIRIFTNDGFYLKHSSLTSFLDSIPSKFIRIHRSHIVNLANTMSYSSIGHGDLEIQLKSGQRLRCSRSFASEFRLAFAGRNVHPVQD